MARFTVPSASPSSTASDAGNQSTGRFEVPSASSSPTASESSSIRQYLGPPQGALGLLRHENIGELGDYRANDTQSLQELLITKRRPSRLPTETSFRGLPESLVWHTLISLLKAVTHLHTGRNDRVLLPGWLPVVHNSIAPSNIIYEHPIPQRIRDDLPACRLGNFARSVVLPTFLDPEDDDEISDRVEAFEHLYFAGERTAFEAPELVGDGDEIPGLESDLWSIGAVIVAMMTGGKTVWDLLLETEFESSVRTIRPRGEVAERWRQLPQAQRFALLQDLAGTSDIASALPDKYPIPLRILIEALLVFDPMDRGEAIDVLEDAETQYEQRIAEGLADYVEPGGPARIGEAVRHYRRAVQEADDLLARD